MRVPVPSRFFEFARPYARSYTLGLVLLLATNGLSLWIPWLLRDAIGQLEAGTPLSGIAWLALWKIEISECNNISRPSMGVVTPEVAPSREGVRFELPSLHRRLPICSRILRPVNQMAVCKHEALSFNKKAAQIRISVES